ncbi:MAG: hypothetical protein JNL39_10865 [Opitutaceae bacterium]|nr:hypothetical protein [Opitutaceae bacterium]
MKRRALAFLFAGVCLGAAEPAWQTLFDGKSLAGWADSRFEGAAVTKAVPAFRDGQGAIVIEPG